MQLYSVEEYISLHRALKIQQQIKIKISCRKLHQWLYYVQMNLSLDWLNNLKQANAYSCSEELKEQIRQCMIAGGSK